MLVSTDDGAVDVVDAPVNSARGIGLRLNLRKDAVPKTRLAPAVEAAGYGGPAPISLGQVPPWGTGAQDPQDTVDDLAVIDRRAARLRFLRWQQRLQPLPLLVR